MPKHPVEKIFEECGAILEGHFVLSSKKHSGKYLDKARIYTDPERVCDLCLEMANKIKERYQDIEAVVAPALGGIILAQWLAYFLRSNHQEKILSLFTEKDQSGSQILKRSYQKLVAGKKVLIVDDILTTGSSIKQVIEEVKKSEGRVMAVEVICNRGGVTSEKIGGYPLFSLWETKIESWSEDECPLCKAGVPVNPEVGRGEEFLAKKPANERAF